MVDNAVQVFYMLTDFLATPFIKYQEKSAEVVDWFISLFSISFCFTYLEGLLLGT